MFQGSQFITTCGVVAVHSNSWFPDTLAQKILNMRSYLVNHTHSKYVIIARLDCSHKFLIILMQKFNLIKKNTILE